MRALTTGASAAVFTLLAAGAGCHRAAPAAMPIVPQQASNQDSIARANARRDSTARADEARRREMARADSVRRAEEASAARESARASFTAPIHFDFDQAAILEADRPLLDQKLAFMRANPALHIRIAGNTDERGSDEYNLALGMRRAAAAKRYLTDRAVDGQRIEVISNGEERPTCQDHDESCWGKNRRAEFEIITTDDMTAVR